MERSSPVRCRARQGLWAHLELEEDAALFVSARLPRQPVAAQFNPHVIIMDISMPEFDGYQGALALRDDVHTREVAIVAFTAFDEAELQQHIVGHEFDAYCQKGQAPLRLATPVTLFAH
ncbi:response regulator [Caballeronia sp. 15711]|uniref:response regulator n=1 Tax=Caballeronia sp. 15711 TaxID=3391029 RepID=UPI0039E3E34A